MKLNDDDFALFELPQRFSLEREVLDQRWRALQAQVHPDRHAAAGGAAQRVAMQWAVRVNEAYRRLKHPLERAAYLCELRGRPVQAQTNTAMPAAFLQQQMAWREALDEAADLAALDTLAAELRTQERRRLSELAAHLDTPEGDTAAAAAVVRELMFLARFQQELDRRADAFETPN